MTAAEDRYLATEAEEYTERICRKAQIHGVRLSVEAQAALTAALAVLAQAMKADGELGEFRTLVHAVVSDILDREYEFSPEERPVS